MQQNKLILDAPVSAEQDGIITLLVVDARVDVVDVYESVNKWRQVSKDGDL